MAKSPRVSAREALRAFERAGFVMVRQKGSHCILKREGHPYHLVLPVHAGATLGPGLLNSLIDAAGLTVEQFAELLRS
jgi:predicted RNA binding protein YcfA (HicA-like mRNA interferase family)